MGEGSRRNLRTHNLVFSIYQIRLVGIFIVILFLSRLFVATCSGMLEPSLVRLSIQGSIINSLPLLPLGISLYLLGAGYRRHPRELKLLPHICNSLPFFAILCGVIFPVILLFNLHSAVAESTAAKLTPYQYELISYSRLLPALFSSVITGIGFHLISKQMRRTFRKYNVNCSQFFGSRMA